MAESPQDNANETRSVPDTAAIEQQIASLRREISKLGRPIADRTEQDASAEALTVARVVRNNPGTVSSAVFLGAGVGVVIGLMLAQLNDDTHSWRDRLPYIR